MNSSKKCTAINALLFSALILTGAFAGAAESVNASANMSTAAASVMHLSGPLLATRTDGTSRILAPNSAVNPGETLITQKNGYAQIKFSDGSMLILRPATAITVDEYSYDAGKPENDRIVFTLQQGGVRSNAGLLGKRSKDRVTINTPGGTVGLENASAIVQYQPPAADAQVAQRAFLFASTAALDASMMATRTDAPLPAANLVIAQLNIPLPTGLSSTAPGATPMLPPGLYVQVIDGLINVSNKGGVQNFAAGQFGYTASPTQPPAIIPKNPAIQFTLPPSFSAPPPLAGSTAPPKSNTFDCEVR